MTTEQRLQRLERQSRLYRHLLILAALTYGATLAPSLYAAEKQRVAVLEFTVRGKVDPVEAEVLAEELREALAKSGKFELAGPELTAQVYKAWLSQPANLKDGNKAVNVGKRFDVQLIVTGKLYKFSTGWQVSAVMLNARTGETKKSQTYRARGDFITLLERKVPALGRILSGTEPARQARREVKIGDRLSGLELNELLAGRVARGYSVGGNRYKVTLHKHGGAEATWWDPTSRHDFGSWWVSGDKYCTKYRKIRSGRKACYSLTKVGPDKYLVTDNKGNTRNMKISDE